MSELAMYDDPSLSLQNFGTADTSHLDAILTMLLDDPWDLLEYEGN